jgi:hypothetical protein
LRKEESTAQKKKGNKRQRESVVVVVFAVRVVDLHWTIGLLASAADFVARIFPRTVKGNCQLAVLGNQLLCEQGEVNFPFCENLENPNKGREKGQNKERKKKRDKKTKCDKTRQKMLKKKKKGESGFLTHLFYFEVGFTRSPQKASHVSVLSRIHTNGKVFSKENKGGIAQRRNVVVRNQFSDIGTHVLIGQNTLHAENSPIKLGNILQFGWKGSQTL